MRRPYCESGCAVDEHDNDFWAGEWDGHYGLRGKGMDGRLSCGDISSIFIGYYKNYRSPTTGNYIYIEGWGEFKVGERYIKDGKMWDRGTSYRADGTETQYDKKC